MVPATYAKSLWDELLICGMLDGALVSTDKTFDRVEGLERIW
jgi:hypothetical protein